ncbi:MAG: prepilin-type N-terminal cleavage/methylation domain-containing protein [Bradymonadaceae bacterium]
MKGQRQTRGRAGFTLVEVMVASLIFAVGMLGVLAMQYQALSGYTFSRDLTGATQVGRRVVEFMKAESHHWRQHKSLTQKGKFEPVYKKKSGYWHHDSLLRAVVDNAWTWQSVFTEPVDIRLSDAGARRYCVFLRGDELQDPKKAGSASTGIVQVQVAVVFPGGDRMFPGATQSKPAGTCSGQVSVSGGQKSLTSIIDPVEKGKIPEYEKAGFRVVHMGATIVQRKHLERGGRNRRRSGS